jgi:hypothetical protein
MADRATVIRSFNDYFCDFLDDILRVLPNNKQVTNANRTFKTLIEMNKTILIKCWYKFVYCKYSHVIDDGNIDFFFEKDYSSDLANLNNSQNIIEIINSVREPAKMACENPTNRAYIVEYIKNLCKLSIMFNDIAGTI